MRLAFMLYPESDLRAAVERWQQYGLCVRWWPDDETVILGAPDGTRAEVMLEDDPAEHRLGPGPVFVVYAVDGFRHQHDDLDWLLDPCDVPAGRYAAYADPNGSAIRILDLTRDIGEHGALFAPR